MARRKTARFRLTKQQLTWIALGGAGLLLFLPLVAGAGVKRVSYLGKSGLPRGMRNNNPGNIVITSRAWSGKIPTGNTDGRFEQFKAYYYGVAAMIILLRDNYIAAGRNTIRTILQRYAPSFENDTNAYAAKVAQLTGWSQDKKIGTGKEEIRKLVQAMAKIENGRDAIDDATFNAAWAIT